MSRTNPPIDDRYFSSELLYRSSRTTVHRAMRRDGVAVVVKSASEGQRDPTARRWLLNEHRVLAGRDIPGSLRVLELRATRRGPALESVDFHGTALSLADARGRSVGAFLTLAREIAEAVQTLHTEGITHRDLSPGNIIRRPDGSALCLIDFGLATRAPRVTRDPIGARHVEGTLGFLSPEQTGRLNRPVDRRADLYTLGATFFALLTGRAPFEGNDPVALVHATVALAPPRVDALRHDVPAVLADLIARLLAKMPDDRYQTADALARDLRTLEETWAAHGSLQDVALPRDDRPDHLVLPDRLYGREGARHDLQDAIVRLRSGAVSAIAVVGGAGVGKTALVRELHRMLADTDASFAEGKLDPLQRGAPYAPVLAVLRALIQRTLAGDDLAVQAWGQRLRDALAGDHARLIDLVPEAAALVGPSGQAEVLQLAEARARLHVLLRRSLQVFHAPDRPLVVFLDDLQWADEATLSLLRGMVEQRAPEDPLLVLGWRGDEASAEGAVAELAVRWEPRQVPRIHVRPLRVDDVAALLVDALGADGPEAVAELAALLHHRVGGNAQMLRELLTSLSQDGAFAWDGARHRLTWDIARIAAAPAPDGVAELLTPRLERLPAHARLALEVASCLGGTFDPALVRAVTGATREAFAEAITLALEAGLLVGDDAAWEVAMDEADAGARRTLRFAHDRVHEAVHAALSDDRREATHLALGRRLLAEVADDGADDGRVFATVDQMRLAPPAALTRDERLQLAELGLRAARRARQQAAFEAALTCAGAAIRWLDGGDWVSHYALTRDLHLLAAEMLVLCPAAEDTAPYAERALARARDVIDRVSAQSILIRGHNARADHAAVVRDTVEALRWLGVDVTEDPGMPRVLLLLARLKPRLNRLAREGRASLKVTGDPAVLAAQALISGCTASAYLVSTSLLPMLLLRSAELSLDRGASAGSAYGFAAYTFMLAQVLDDLPGALRFAALARELAAALDGDAARVRVETLCMGFCDARVQPLGSIAEPMADLARRAAALGDGEYAGLNSHNTLDAALAGGRDLDLIAAEAPGWVRLCVTLGEDRGRRFNGFLLHMVQVLRGEAAASEAGWEAARAELYGGAAAAAADKSLEGTYHFARVAVALYMGDVAGAAAAAEGSGEWIKALPGAFQIYAGVAHLGVSRLLAALDAPAPQRVRLAALAALDLRRLRGWAAGAPAVFGHRVSLLEALGNELAGRREAAVRAVETAVSEARRADVTPDLALALDVASRIYDRHGHRRVAASVLGEAMEVWRQWGATAVVERVEHRLSSLGGERPATTPGTSSLNSSTLDAATLVRAARALSAEIVLDDLLRRLVELATTNAGADRASLWLQTPEGLRVTARARATADGVVGERVRDDRGDGDPAAAVAQYVARTQEQVLLRDAEHDGRFFRGASRRPRSVLCVPLRKGSQLVGVLYLQSEVVAGAFTDERVEVVTVMAAQAAVSIDNARLYEDLRASLDRQRKLTGAFERFMPNQFLEQLAKTDILDVSLGDQSQREVTVMFCDIRGFSALASQLGPSGTFAFINKYLGYMEPAIHAHGGFINQFLGDGIMALFPGQTDQALTGALAMLEALARFNAERRTEGLPDIRVSIGLNSGPLMLGVIGGSRRFDRGVVGDAVNLASRVEGMTRQFNSPLLLGGETCARLGVRDDFLLRSLGWVVPVGQRNPIEVFESLDAHAPELRAACAASADDYAAGLDRWVAGDFEAASGFFTACVVRNPGDGAARFMVARCEEMIAKPPKGPWDGVIRLKSK